MSLALIQESAKEVRRLAIAGSPLAVGDFRLRKLISPLEQAGQKAPVFGQVAKAIADLVNGKETESAANLLGLSTLLNAILYTQGESGTAAVFQELESFSTSAGAASTRTSARLLKPLVEALTTTGSGRFETVKSAIERGQFNDLRLIEPSIRALNDNYPELADLVAETILPAYGPGIIPLLKQGFNAKGKKSDARRLWVMHKLDPKGTLELCQAVVDEGSAEVKETAILCLGEHGDCLPLVLEQAGAKNKSLRAAALRALAGYDRDEVTKVFLELIKGKSLELLAGPFRNVKNRQVVEALFEEGKRVFGLLVKGDEDSVPRFWEILDCLQGRKDAKTEAFVLECFQQCDKVSKLKGPKTSHLAGADIVDRLTSLLEDLETPQALEAVLAKRDVLPLMAFPQIFRSALKAWPAPKVFQEFSPLLEQKKGGAKEKAEEIQRVISSACWDDSSRFQFLVDDDPFSEDAKFLKNLEWDPRWLDAAIKADNRLIVCSLARPGHKGAIDYLLKLAVAKNFTESGFVIRALARCQYPKITDVFMDLVTRKTKSARYVDYEVEFLFESARHLPAADLPKLDEFAAKLDEKFMDSLLEHLAPLRPVGQAAQTAPE